MGASLCLVPARNGRGNYRAQRERGESAERKVIQLALDVNNYNMSRSAEALGVSRPSLYNLMKKLGMSTETNNRQE